MRHAIWILIGIFAALWLAILVTLPVHIPIVEYSREYIPSYTHALSGVKGQTLTVPSDGLSRIDVWIRTHVEPGGYVRVKFELKSTPELEHGIASGIVVFDRSGSDWQARLTVDPEMISKNDPLYLRLESILSSPASSLHYSYFAQDLYPHGELLELDQLTVPDQDLRFKLYRDPSLPKPFAWAEAAIAPAIDASHISAGAPAWIIVAAMVAAGALYAALAVTCGVLAARLLAVAHRREAAAAVVLALFAAAAAILAGAEAPIGKLWVPLT